MGTTATSSCQIWTSNGVPCQRCARTWTSAAAPAMAPSSSSAHPMSTCGDDQSMAAGLRSRTRPARPRTRPATSGRVGSMRETMATMGTTQSGSV